MISKKQRVNIVKPILKIDGINIESVDHFNFLGLTLDSRMTWNNHTTNISNKIKCSRTIGVLNRIKHFIPLIVRILLYNTLILPHFNYCITAWGYQCDSIIKLQKKAIRIISISTYNAHTEPLLKNLRILKIQDIKGKGSFYIAQYPVRWTAQSALHFLPSLADLFIPTPTRLLREAF